MDHSSSSTAPPASALAPRDGSRGLAMGSHSPTVPFPGAGRSRCGIPWQLPQRWPGPPWTVGRCHGRGRPRRHCCCPAGTAAPHTGRECRSPLGSHHRSAEEESDGAVRTLTSLGRPWDPQGGKPARHSIPSPWELGSLLCLGCRSSAWEQGWSQPFPVGSWLSQTGTAQMNGTYDCVREGQPQLCTCTAVPNAHQDQHLLITPSWSIKQELNPSGS